MGDWTRLLEVARSRGGVVHLDEARASGFDPRTILRRAAAEGWWHPFPEVVAVGGVLPDPVLWAQAAVLHAGRGREGAAAGVTGDTALWLHGVLRTPPSAVELVGPPRPRIAPHPRINAHVSRSMSAQELSPIRGVPTVSGARIIRDLTGASELEVLRNRIIDLVQRGVVTLDELRDDIDRFPTLPGRSRLRRAVGELRAAGRTDSPLEFRLRRALQAAGIPLDRGQVPVDIPGGRRIHLDVGILAIRFGIEADSMLAHSTRSDLQRDLDRANLVASSSDEWRVLRCSWEVFGAGWPAFIRQVRELVSAQSRRHLGLPWPRPEDVAA